MKQDMMGGGSSISSFRWTICKSFAPHSRQTTMTEPHHSVFTGQMPFVPYNQQHQSTEAYPTCIMHPCWVTSFKFRWDL